MKRMRLYVALAVVWGFAVVCVAPYLWMWATAFKSRMDVTASPPKLLFLPTLDNLRWSYNGQPLIPILANTCAIAAGTMAVTLVLGLPSAYFFARQRSRWSQQLFLFILSTRIAPPIALSLPFFIVFTYLGLRGTHVGVILIHSVFNLSFVIWLLEGFFAEIPLEVEMAAQIDGRTRLGALLFVVLPMAAPGISAGAFFTFVFSWNEYMMASLLSSPLSRPLTPSLPGFIAQATTQWGQFCVVATVSSLPVLMLAFLFRRFLSRGLTSGVVRGV